MTKSTVLHRILCPVDFSEGCLRAFEFALGLARQSGAVVEALHVLQLPMYALPDGAILSSPELALERSNQLQEQLDELLERYVGAGVKLESRLTSGITHLDIVQRAKESHADMIVMSTHARSGLQRLLLGSVAERVLRTSPVPVCVVPGVAHV